MIIKSIYIGNLKEAYVEKRFDKKMNIIYSNDNNKGKTIIIQSILYCLGNEPVFPASFDYENYYYILTIESNGQQFDICRRKNNFTIKNNNNLFVFDTLSEYKNYWNKYIDEIPIIIKDGKKRVTDLVLLIQLFFVGQDKKMTHDIVNSKWLKKEDFKNMLYSLAGIEVKLENTENIEKLKIKLKNLEIERKNLLKTNEILKNKNLAVQTLSTVNDKIELEKKLKAVEKINKEITELRKNRNNIIKRKVENESVIKELRSLNRTIKVGHISCMDCGSTHIEYNSGNEEFNFDISTPKIRNTILDSIEEKIGFYVEEINRITEEISIYQEELNAILETEEDSIENLILVKNDLHGIKEVEQKINYILKEEDSIQNIIKNTKLITNNVDKNKKNIINKIVDEMNNFNNYVDFSNSDIYHDIFTSRSQVYSGSEGTQFHLAKLYAFARVLQHDYPIIVDSFRAEELSTKREEKVLDKYKELDNQIILTTTLKNEEFFKYQDLKNINIIDYSDHPNYHILNSENIYDLRKKLKEMMIMIDSNN